MRASVTLVNPDGQSAVVPDAVEAVPTSPDAPRLTLVFPKAFRHYGRWLSLWQASGQSSGCCSNLSRLSRRVTHVSR
jgi:hypothetical protein